MAQMNPQLAALLAAMQGGGGQGPVLGRGTVQSQGDMPDFSGLVQGGDGARIPRPSPENGGIYGAPGEKVLGGPFGDPRMPADNEDDEQNTNNSTSVDGAANNLGSLLAAIGGLVSPGTYNTRHPITLMNQIHPGKIASPNQSGGSFGRIDQAATRRNVISNRLNS